MTDKSAPTGNLPDPNTMDTDHLLEWDRTSPGETRLLLEEDTVYTEDLVRLGLGWQDFSSLVVRAQS